MIRKLLLSILSLFLNTKILYAGNNPNDLCFALENTTIYDFCVPSHYETCHTGEPGNCEIKKQTKECVFVREPSSFLRYEPRKFKGLTCSSYTPCPPPPPGTEHSTCNQTCLKYDPPVCEEDCYPCFLKTINKLYPLTGCGRLCKAKYCNNEPRCQSVDIINVSKPVDPCTENEIIINNEKYILPLVSAVTCENNQRCPKTIHPPAGFTVEPCDQNSFKTKLKELCPNCVPGENCTIEVSIRTSNTKCDPPETKREVHPIMLACPWIDFSNAPSPKDDFGTCDPVPIGNRFPMDCCECTDNRPVSVGPPQVPCQTCGILKPRCTNYRYN